MTQQMPGRVPGGAMDLSHLAARAAQAAQPGATGPQGAGRAGTGSGRPAGGTADDAQVIELASVVFDLTDDTFEQVIQLSSVVPVVVDLWAEWCQPCKTLSPILEKVTREFAGRVVLAKVDVDSNPALSQAFQAQSIPTVVALIGGRPVPLFQGAVPEAQVREVYTQLLQLAEQQGLNGRVKAGDIEGDDAGAEPTEPPVNPAHVAALEAIDRGDYAGAVEAYEQVLLKAPADHEAKAALVQVRMLHRLDGLTVDEIRGAAAADPADTGAQLRVADLDVSGGHVEDAFLRLLDLFTASDDEAEKTQVRERLLELFEVVGQTDPRVAQARMRLANLLY